ncbi:hypothetical protein F4808DRAFT_468537 [Astrocystis sublimbata]|nr:hypothetical protein F4808DRAFT_468537 [Astrocystis sublimbata]
MYSSWFSYPITRAYPYRWVTPLTIVGGVIAIVAVTFINLAVTGYDLNTHYFTNPDDVSRYEAKSIYKYLSVFSKTPKSRCSSTMLQLNSEVFTLNYAMPYTISRIWLKDPDMPQENLGSLNYLNNQLLDCNVTEVGIQVQGSNTQNILFTARSRVGLLLTPKATCTIKIDSPVSNHRSSSSLTYFELVGSYKLIDDTIPRFLLSNTTEKNSLYWGESLLQLYSLFAAHAYYDAAQSSTQGDDYNAYIELSRMSNATSGSAAEVMSDDFFQVACFTTFGFCGTDTNNITALSSNEIDPADSYKDPYPSIWKTFSFLGKAMWFTVMTDLGQNTSNLPNMLAYPDLLANLTSNVTNEVETWDAARPNFTVLSPDTSLATTSFDPSAVPQPALGARPSFLSTTYACQLPEPQPLATRIFAIIYADLVLLGAIWSGYQLLLATIVNQNHPSSTHCEGCLASQTPKESESLIRTESNSVDAEKGSLVSRVSRKQSVTQTRYMGVDPSDNDVD